MQGRKGNFVPIFIHFLSYLDKIQYTDVHNNLFNNDFHENQHSESLCLGAWMNVYLYFTHCCHTWENLA
jgi:hypothetical protein